VTCRHPEFARLIIATEAVDQIRHLFIREPE